MSGHIRSRQIHRAPAIPLGNYSGVPPTTLSFHSIENISMRLTGQVSKISFPWQWVDLFWVANDLTFSADENPSIALSRFVLNQTQPTTPSRVLHSIELRRQVFHDEMKQKENLTPGVIAAIMMRTMESPRKKVLRTLPGCNRGFPPSRMRFLSS